MESPSSTPQTSLSTSSTVTPEQQEFDVESDTIGSVLTLLPPPEALQAKMITQEMQGGIAVLDVSGLKFVGFMEMIDAKR
jgi:hypothetical protein